MRFRTEAAANLGLAPGQVRRAVATYVKGAKVGEVFKDQKVYDVAEIGIEPTPNEIKRESASRRIDVTCNADGRDLGGTSPDTRSNTRWQ